MRHVLRNQIMTYYKVKIKMKWNERKKRIRTCTHNFSTSICHTLTSAPLFYANTHSLLLPALVENDVIFFFGGVMMDQMVYAYDYWLNVNQHYIPLTIIWYQFKFIRLKHFILGVNLANFQIDIFKFQWI